MDATAGRNVGCRDVRKSNDLLRSSASNLQVIVAIHHFVRKTVDLRLPKKIYKKGAKDACRKQACRRILPQAAIEHGGSHRKRDQRGGTQPNAALEQGSIPERDDSHDTVAFRGRQSLLDGIDRRAERLRHQLPEPSFVQSRNIDAGGRNHFGLVNGDIGHCKALDHLSVARDKVRGASLIVVGPRGYGFPSLKHLAKFLAVWNPGQKPGHCRCIVESRRRQCNFCAHVPTIYHRTMEANFPSGVTARAKTAKWLNTTRAFDEKMRAYET
jgi:hypothetical protein